MNFQIDAIDKKSIHQRVSSVVELMPPFPQSVLRLMEMTEDINCCPKDLVKVIEHDPVMTLKILKLVNSAFFALSRDVVSIQHALVYLGMNTVKNLAISIATIDALPHKSIAELPMDAFLTHALATALVAQRMAKHDLHRSDSSEYFIAGLLHGFGKVLFVQMEPHTYALVLQDARERACALAQVELEDIGISYAQVGAMLVERWQLPASLVDCIRQHVQCDSDSSDMSIVIAAASMVATAMQLGESGDVAVDVFPDCIEQRLNADMDMVIRRMQSLHDEVQQMQGVVGGS